VKLFYSIALIAPMKLKPSELLFLLFLLAVALGGCNIENPFATKAIEPAPTPAPILPRFARVDCKISKCVAITYDDGPDQYTLKYLKMLKVPATFFVVGKNVQLKPDVVKQASLEGHQICNHSWNHPNMAKLSAKAVDEQIAKTDAVIVTTIGDKYKPCFRFPFASIPRGFFKSHPNLLHVAWTNDSMDWRYKDPNVQYKKVFGNAVPPNGIVLFHDIHPGALTTSPRVITELQKQGFTFVTVDELNLPVGELNMAKNETKKTSITTIKKGKI
jgi:peptidoglycan/xylan/chitin deacetylase (PgdA/CDA1 family)